MLKNLQLDRPIAFIDVETTGLRPYTDRIVELSTLKIHPDDSEEYKNLEQTEVAVKFINTSVYGVNGFKGFRLFDLDCANAITAVGRMVIVALRDGLGAKGFPVCRCLAGRGG